ncbi:MAG: hypothetical protein UT42_C0001G0006 [Candidatus Falkowbacteria bacterium GW2011_GWA2_39_24]|uniref:Uncharacterized protein n=1 Tax=Candidatus Falkowbacteria bacterium GW2011_GWA2_39_24 TaxID=1618634 RepID=A0A0G0NH26_9BACT|nr:MAG: hypothetical protein UT42_C0001G0006 [Candidatus Falkowbacteria bacterium GW2011_GWA2_39_24]
MIIKGVNLLCAQGRAGQAQHLFSWRRISQSEIRKIAAGAGFEPAVPLRIQWFSRPSE